MSATEVINDMITYVTHLHRGFISYDKIKLKDGTIVMKATQAEYYANWLQMQYYGIDIKKKTTMLYLMRMYVEALELLKKKSIKKFCWQRNELGFSYDAVQVIRKIELVIYIFSFDTFGGDNELYNKIQASENISYTLMQLRDRRFLPDEAFSNETAVAPNDINSISWGF